MSLGTNHARSSRKRDLTTSIGLQLLDKGWTFEEVQKEMKLLRRKSVPDIEYIYKVFDILYP